MNVMKKGMKSPMARPAEQGPERTSPDLQDPAAMARLGEPRLADLGQLPTTKPSVSTNKLRGLVSLLPRDSTARNVLLETLGGRDEVPAAEAGLLLELFIRALDHELGR